MSSLYRQVSQSKLQAGFSLLEVSVVVFILGVLAYVVIPDFSATSQQKLDLAAAEVAQAIRSARNESMRSGKVHGITVNQDTQTITVKEYDMTTSPVSLEAILYHPVDKKPYQFELESGSLSANVSISNSQDAFLFNDSVRRKSVLFDASGSPFWYVASTATTYQLVSGAVQLGYAQQTRVITLAPLSGRVTQQ